MLIIHKTPLLSAIGVQRDEENEPRKRFVFSNINFQGIYYTCYGHSLDQFQPGWKIAAIITKYLYSDYVKEFPNLAVKP